MPLRACASWRPCTSTSRPRRARQDRPTGRAACSRRLRAHRRRRSRRSGSRSARRRCASPAIRPAENSSPICLSSSGSPPGIPAAMPARRELGDQAAERRSASRARAAGRCRPRPRAPARASSCRVRFRYSSSVMTTRADHGADRDHVPGQPAAEDAARDRGHQRRLRRGERIDALAGRRADAVGLEQQVEHRRHDRGARDRTDAEHDLLPPRRRADELAGLEVLQVVAADRGRAADHGADHDRGDRTDGGPLPRIASRISEANRIVEIVMPETGLFDEPTRPAM